MVKTHPPSLVRSLIAIALAIIIMGFLRDAAAEMIGGVIGGLVVFVLLSRWTDFRSFEIRYLSPSESMTAEHMHVSTALRVDTGKFRARIRIRPRRGIELCQYDFAFFDKGLLPCQVGRRRYTNEVKVCAMRYFDPNSRVFQNADIRIIEHEGSISSRPAKTLARGNAIYLEVDFDVSETLKFWEGVFSLQLQYEHNGNREQTNVRTKFFVRPSRRYRPLRAIGKKILNCEPVQSNSAKGNSRN